MAEASVTGMRGIIRSQGALAVRTSMRVIGKVRGQALTLLFLR